MTLSLGTALPPEMARLLDGNDLQSKEGVTFLLLSVNPQGWPHMAMLSAGELIARSDRTLRCALWPDSTTTANLASSAQALVASVIDHRAIYIRCRSRELPRLRLASGQELAHFELDVDEVREDIAPYAELLSGVTFRLKDKDAVIARWRETVAAMAPTAS